MEQATTRVIVIEDDDVMRKSLIANIDVEADLEVVADCATYEDGRAAIRDIPAEIIVTDLRLPDGHGTDLIRLARQDQPGAEIMVISVLGDEQSVVAAISAGASGFLLKDSRQLDLVRAIRDLLNGLSPISTAIARFIIKIVQKENEATLDKSILTQREMDILWGIAKGYTYNDVAERLGISKNTVPSHIKNIYRKLEVNSRSEAVFEAIQRGWINIS